MTTVQPDGSLWPADIIHVNEDGWVLINRGSRHGAVVGLRLLVVGTGIRDLHDLFAGDSAETQPPVARIRRTYEELEIVYAEENCAIAIATRTPSTRRPTVYRGPDGELLVWVPLPEGYSWPPSGNADTSDTTGDAEDYAQSPTPPWVAADHDAADTTSGDAHDADDDANQPDAPPERAPQDDQPWEEALPLNSVSVGDIVLPAIPAVPSAPTFTPPAPAAPTTSGASASDTSTSATSFEEGRSYDWMNKPSQ